MNKENMSYASVLSEMQRLEVYKADQLRNLPEVVYSTDRGVQAATDRIEVLQSYLDIEQKAEEQRKMVESVALAASAATLDVVLQDFRDLVVTIEDKCKTLHHTHRSRVMTILDQVKKELH